MNFFGISSSTHSFFLSILFYNEKSLFRLIFHDVDYFEVKIINFRICIMIGAPFIEQKLQKKFATFPK